MASLWILEFRHGHDIVHPCVTWRVRFCTETSKVIGGLIVINGDAESVLQVDDARRIEG